MLGDVVLARLYGGSGAAHAALPVVVRRARRSGTDHAGVGELLEARCCSHRPAGRRRPLRERWYGPAVGAAYVEGVAMVSLLSAAVVAGDHGVAVATFPDAVRHWQRSSMWVQQWTTLRLLAELLVDLEVLEPAAVLLGAADADADAPRVSGPDVDRARALVAALERSRGPADTAAAARGAALSRREVLELALDVALPAAAAAIRWEHARRTPSRTGRPGGRCPDRTRGGLRVCGLVGRPHVQLAGRCAAGRTTGGPRSPPTSARRGGAPPAEQRRGGRRGAIARST